MGSCTLSKSKVYPIQNIFFSSTDNNYQLTLANPPAGCSSGIFTSKKLELKIVPNNTMPFLHFNKQDGLPELILNNMSQVKQAGQAQVPVQAQAPMQAQTLQQPPMSSHNSQMPQEQSSSHMFLYAILGIIVIILIIRFISKRNQTPPPYSLDNNNPNNYLNGNSNNMNNPNNPNGPFNNGPMGQQPPSRTGSFLTGLAGGALGAVVGNELYDKFKGNSANAAENPNPNNSNANDTFSSDDNSSNSDDDTFSGGDDSFSSDD